MAITFYQYYYWPFVISWFHCNHFIFPIIRQESIKSQASTVKTVMVSHQQLIGEVKSMLTTMAKVRFSFLA